MSCERYHFVSKNEAVRNFHCHTMIVFFGGGVVVLLGVLRKKAHCASSAAVHALICQLECACVQK